MKPIRHFMLALLLVLAGKQAAAQIDRSTPPAPGPAPTVSFPEFHETQLDNGLKVFVISNHAQPVVTFRLLFRTGSEYDGEKSGIAEFTTDLLTSGTTSRSSLEFAQEADFLGLSLGAGAADDQMSVSGSGLKKHMDKLLALMTDALYNASFPQDELDKLKKQTLSGLKTIHKDPDAVMGRLQITVGYNVHPYAAFQTAEDVEAITRQDLVSFHRNYFIPNNASLAVVGDVTVEEILPVLQRYFGDWKTGRVPQSNFPAPKPIEGRSVHLVDLGKTQSQTAVTVSTTAIERSNPDYIAFSMMNSILGGGFSGRLFANLREKHAFTYGAYSSVEARKNAGLWNAAASVRRIATDSAFAQIILEMERMRSETVESSELDMHKQYASGRFLLGLENPSTIATMVQNIDLYNLPKDYYRTYVQNVMAMTPADIQRVAKKYLAPNDIALLAVGDASVIAEPLAQFGEVSMYDADMQPVADAQTFEVDIDGPTLIGKVVEAMGGRETLENIESRITEANVTITAMGGESEGVLKTIEMAPNKKHQLITIAVDMGGGMQMLEIEEWCDGKTAAERQPMSPAQDITGEDLDKTLESNLFNEMLHVAERGYGVTVKEKKTMDGRTVYSVEIAKKHSTDEIFVDAETFLLHGKTETADTAHGPITNVTRFSDYREVDGVMLPFTITQENPATNLTATVTSYKHNVDIDESVFSRK
ncbi:MAG: insulinase family protein [Bacteroidetes bacterium]|nr:insulinase family protein [Bacteroidota bacterium]